MNTLETAATLLVTPWTKRLKLLLENRRTRFGDAPLRSTDDYVVDAWRRVLDDMGELPEPDDPTFFGRLVREACAQMEEDAAARRM